ncbi:MAG: excinuclease ABC subunit UvrA [Pirellulales bacterium]|nr:excinuclease ABC subunit UvrA [Pirellulales bacterium]
MMGAERFISLRGVEVHNLKSIDLDIPHRKLVVLCGVSGSGKSSLALDTLYAEGQRRYIESFSAYTRQFLQRLEKPEADRIDGIPPAIAVTSKNASRSSRSTVGTATETADYLRLLYAKIGEVFCLRCGQPVRRDTPQSIAELLQSLPSATRYMIAFPLKRPQDGEWSKLSAGLVEDGFIRAVVDGRTVNLTAESPASQAGNDGPLEDWYVVVDRLSAGDTADQRVRDSLETAFVKGQGKAFALIDQAGSPPPANGRGSGITIDGRTWRRIGLSNRLACEDCRIDYPEPEPRLFSFNSPLGACPACEGFGNIIDIDMELLVPDPRKTLREGAIAPWNTPAYAHELEELLALADDFGLPVDVPFSELEPKHLELITDGVPERKFGGLKGFFAWLERRKYKMHIRVFLSRWRSYRACPACGGTRLRPEAMAVRVGGRNIAEVSAMKIRGAAALLRGLELTDWQRQVGRQMLEQVQARLGYLKTVGLGYLTLDRTLRTLSGGEMRRVALSSALGSSLVNMLYVLDEPSIGLHPRDINRLIEAIVGLRNRGNTVVVVEHEEAIIRTADQVIEIGPGAGERGGQVVFQGTPAEMEQSPDSLTGEYLSGRRGISTGARRRAPNHGWIRLAGARGNNLKNIMVEFPLGLLCVVTGVSGSGKSTLVEHTLYPALCRRLRKDAPKPYDCDDVFGDGQIDDVIMVDQSPIGRSPRSNPVTYLKVFDEIRAVFAETVEAKTRGYTASHFSFNVDGGRCPECNGDGYIEIDMQFLADVYMKCSQCNGTRYRDEILDVTYRGRNIAEVLEMTVREAFTFFRGRAKVQARLKRLIDVGLDYVRLGQPANTLSGGEAQRLKLAGYMSSAKRGRCLFLLDEPTTGLHFADVVQLLDCFDALLAVGHSLVVVEHNLQLIKAADYVIDLGPGAADEGGQVVVQGTPEMITHNPDSVTGRFLADALRGAPATG